MKLLPFILLFSTLANLGLAGFILWRRHTRPLHVIAALLICVIACWNLAVFVISISTSVHVLSVVGRGAFSLAALIAGFYLVFTWVFPETHHTRPSKPLMAIVAGTIILMTCIAASPYVQKAVEILPNAGKRPLLGPLHPLYVFYMLLFIGWATANLLKSLYRTKSGRERMQLKYCIAGFVLSFAPAYLANFVLPFITNRTEWWVIGGACPLIWTAATSYAVVRHQLMDIGVALRNTTIVALMSTVLTAFLVLPYFVTVVFAAQAETSTVTLLIVTLAAVLALTLPDLQRQVTRFVDQRLFRGRYDHQTALVRFSDNLMRTYGRENITSLIAREIPIILQAEGGAVYLPDNGGGGYQLYAWSSEESELWLPDVLADHAALVQAVLARNGCITREDVVYAPRPLPGGAEIAESFRTLKATVAVPLLCQSRIQGLVLLGEKRQDNVFTTDELQLLGALASQAAFALDNTRLYEQALASKKHYETILHHMQRGVLAVGTDERIVTLNDMACVILGVTGPEWEGRSAAALAAPLAELLQRTLEHQADQPAKEFSLPLARRIIPCECETSILFDAHNRVIGALAVFQDLSEKKRFQEEVRRMERLASVGTLAAGLAHEIKNPLVSIQTFVQLLPERYQDTHFRDGFGQVVRAEIDRINRLLQNLLEFSRPRPCHIGEVAVHDLLERALTLIENELHKREIQITRRYGEQVPRISADAEQLHQVIFNLLQNAMQAMDRTEKTIIISTAGATIETATGRHAGVELRISDSGHGIDENDLPHIFDPFYSTKANGSGLGLSICHSIIEEHGGSIQATSQPGQGTTFTVRLPVQARGSASRPTTA